MQAANSKAPKRLSQDEKAPKVYSVMAQVNRKDPELSSLLIELGEKHSAADLKAFLLPAVRLLYEMHREGYTETQEAVKQNRNDENYKPIS